MRISRRLLIASGTFGPELGAERVAAAIARGVVAAGLPQPDRCPLEPAPGEDPRALLDSLNFDARMRAAHAVVVATERLEERTLAASVTFEIATRARQSGVPAYAITAADELSAFDGRILDLQVILEANGTHSLSAAARKLAALV